MRCNITDLRMLAGEPLAGAVAAGAGALDGARFPAAARAGLSPALGGTFDAARFERQHDWHTTGGRRNDQRHP
jgi:dethiobiotin synthetase